MNYNPETKSGFYISDKRRLSLEAVSLRRSSSNDYSNYEGAETEVLECDAVANERQRRSALLDIEGGDDAGFAAIELLRPPSASMDDPNAQSEDASSTDEGGGDDLGYPSSSRRDSNGVDLSFMSFEDLLYQLQREIVSSVSQSEAANRQFRQRSPGSSTLDNPKKFIWSGNARNLLENAIMKFRHQSEANGCQSLMESSEFYDTLNSIFLPLWPHGWMSPDELAEIIHHLAAPNQMDDEPMEDHERAHEHYSMGQNFGSNEGSANSLYSAILNDNGTTTSVSASAGAYSSGGDSPVIANVYSKAVNRSSVLQGNTGGGGGAAGTSASGAAMCFICDRSFQSAHLLKIHISHMHTPKALVCPHCQSRHSTLNGLRFHFSTKHKGFSQRFISDLVPPIPVITMVSGSSSNAGQQQAASSATATAYIESRPIGAFENSSTAISNMNSMIRNQLPHHSANSASLQNGSSTSTVHEPNEVECSSCKNKFATVGSLKAHISMMHTEKSVRCRYCPNMYATQRAMLQHTYLKHHKERNCQCPQCGETFRTSGLANLHRRYAHTCNTAMPPASISAKMTSSPSQPAQRKSEKETATTKADPIVHTGPISAVLQSAMNRIRGNGKYHCRDCGAGFPMPSAVWAHRKKEHSESTSIKKRGVFSVSLFFVFRRVLLTINFWLFRVQIQNVPSEAKFLVTTSLVSRRTSMERRKCASSVRFAAQYSPTATLVTFTRRRYTAKIRFAGN